MSAENNVSYRDKLRYCMIVPGLHISNNEDFPFFLKLCQGMLLKKRMIKNSFPLQWNESNINLDFFLSIAMSNTSYPDDYDYSLPEVSSSNSLSSHGKVLLFSPEIVNPLTICRSDESTEGKIKKILQETTYIHNFPVFQTSVPSEKLVSVLFSKSSDGGQLGFHRNVIERSNHFYLPIWSSSSDMRQWVSLLPESKHDIFIRSISEYNSSRTSQHGKQLSEESLLACIRLFVVPLSYIDFTVPELMKLILPENILPLSGFEQIGHIAHLNLSEPHIPYRFMIGQMILDHNPSVRTIVNKLTSISSVYREIKLEVIAGDSSALTATVKQYGCVFEVPYDKVYWNTRLGNEHQRLVDNFNTHDVLFDVMAGVGPFSIPASKKGLTVYANDFNPNAAKALFCNSQLNHANLQISDLDGREFLKTTVLSVLRSLTCPTSCHQHIVMNLPEIAVSFLDVLQTDMWKEYIATNDSYRKSIIFYVYLFTSVDPKDIAEDVLSRIEKHIGCSVTSSDILNIHIVRDVAPRKLMVCASLYLPVAFFTEKYLSKKDSFSDEVLLDYPNFSGDQTSERFSSYSESSPFLENGVQGHKKFRKEI